MSFLFRKCFIKSSNFFFPFTIDFNCAVKHLADELFHLVLHAGHASSFDGVDTSQFDFADTLQPNACFIMKSSRSSVLARYNPFTEKIKKVDKGTRNYGIHYSDRKSVV